MSKLSSLKETAQWVSNITANAAKGFGAISIALYGSAWENPSKTYTFVGGLVLGGLTYGLFNKEISYAYRSLLSLISRRSDNSDKEGG